MDSINNNHKGLAPNTAVTHTCAALVINPHQLRLPERLVNVSETTRGAEKRLKAEKHTADVFLYKYTQLEKLWLVFILQVGLNQLRCPELSAGGARGQKEQQFEKIQITRCLSLYSI